MDDLIRDKIRESWNILFLLRRDMGQQTKYGKEAYADLVMAEGAVWAALENFNRINLKKNYGGIDE